MLIPNFDELPRSLRTEKYICGHFNEFYQYIINNYPKDLTFSEKIYWYRHNIHDYPICKHCGSRVAYAGPSRGYYQFCSLNCSNNNSITKSKKNSTIIQNFSSVEEAYKDRIKKTKQTLISKYGSIEEAYKDRIEKSKQTCLERYGVECSLQNEEARKKTEETLISKYGSIEEAYKDRMEKSKQTCLERYGVGCSLQNEEIRKKAEETWFKKYGVKNPASAEEIKEKSKQTCLERYGVECSLQNEEVRKKAEETLISKYGVKYAQQNTSILNKSLKTKKLKILQSKDDIIDINFTKTNTIYTCKCPHEWCNKCSERQYECDYNCYHNRRYNNIELCTKLLPIKSYHSEGTTIELFVRNILERNNIEYISNDRTILNGLELDIYIPSKKIAIECNGIYWHSLKEPSYHINKYKECEEKGIQLLTIWEDQIINKPKIIESIIKSKLGIYDRKIYARKCIVKLLSSKTTNNFLNNNHLQGAANSGIKLGLYYNNELVSVMTFGCHRGLLNNKNKANFYELYRFCNIINTQVIGAASKLLKYFIKHYHPTQITSFSSNDISDGNIYKILGFNKVSSSKSYWYINMKTLERFHRYKFRKSELIKMGYVDGSQDDFIRSISYLKIFDTGQTKFSLNIK